MKRKAVLFAILILTFILTINASAMYDPQTGRWLSRDPVNEPGFRLMIEGNLHAVSFNPMPIIYVSDLESDTVKYLLYAFVENNPINKYDIYGLQTADINSECERCGPDITLALKQVINQVRADFARWSLKERKRRCNTLRNPFSASAAWDIVELSPSVRHKLDGYGKGCPTTKCKETVEVEGQCVYSSRANYVLWGTMSKLCGWSFNYSMDLMETWKQFAYGHGVDRDTLLYANVGYQGWPNTGMRVPSTTQNLKQCKTDCDVYNKPFSYHWGRSRRSRWAW